MRFKTFEKIVVACSIAIAGWAYVSDAHSAEIPHFTSYVNDYANVLSSRDKSSLNERLADFDKKSLGHAQIVVVIVPTLNGGSIEDYATDAFHNNKIGQKDNNNGILTVLDIGERKSKMEVGYDLEPTISDIKAKSILDNMRPALKSGDYFKALSDETTELMPLVSTGSKELAPVKTQGTITATTTSNHTGFPFMSLIVLIGIGILIYFLYKSLTEKKDPPDTFSSPKRPVPPTVTPDYSNTKTSSYTDNFPTRNSYRPTYTPPPPRAAPTYDYNPEPTYSAPKSDSGSMWKGAAAGAVAGVAASELLNNTRRRDDDDTPSYSSWGSSSSDSPSSSSSYDSGSSSSSDSGYSGGGGDSGGGGASSDW